MSIEPAFRIGKSSVTPEFCEGIREILEARELIKVAVLNNCADDPAELARLLSERTGAEIVQVIGKKIVLYRESKTQKKIILPR